MKLGMWQAIDGGGTGARVVGDDDVVAGGVSATLVEHRQAWRVEFYVYVGVEWPGAEAAHSALTIESAPMDRADVDALVERFKAWAFEIWRALRVMHAEFGGFAARLSVSRGALLGASK